MMINFYNVFWMYWLIGKSEQLDDNDNFSSLMKVTKINNNNNHVLLDEISIFRFIDTKMRRNFFFFFNVVK